MALRAVFDWTPREAPKFLPLRGLVRPHLLLRVKDLIACLCDRPPEPVIDAFRLADAKRCASHEASASAGLGGRTSESVCYPRLRGNSSQAAVI